MGVADNSRGSNGIRGCWLTVNRTCNLRCRWCYAAGAGDKNCIDMPLGLAHRLIDAMAELGVKSVVFIGGEPTLYPQLLNVSRYAVDAGIVPMLVTNGIRFVDKEYCSRVVEAGIRKITISAKGSSEEDYQRLAGVKGFRKMLKGADNLRALGVEPAFEVTVARDHLAKINLLVATLAEQGVKHLTVDLASPVITGESVDVLGVPDPFELRDAVHVIYRSGVSSLVDYIIYMTIPFCLLDPDVLRGLKEEDRLMSSCHVPHGSAVIFDEQGSLLPCNHMCGHVLGRWGTDFSSARGFADFWRASNLRDFRSACGCYPAEPCVTCPDWGECGGGCMIKWLHWNPADFICGLPEHERKRTHNEQR